MEGVTGALYGKLEHFGLVGSVCPSYEVKYLPYISENHLQFEKSKVQ
jgi:hypothetical protein